MKARLHCFDRSCREPVRHRLLDLHMCTRHYLEALEHSAHIASRGWGGLAAIRQERAELLNALLDRPAKKV